MRYRNYNVKRTGQNRRVVSYGPYLTLMMKLAPLWAIILIMAWGLSIYRLFAYDEWRQFVFYTLLLGLLLFSKKAKGVKPS
jgi:hypothetical protein